MDSGQPRFCGIGVQFKNSYFGVVPGAKGKTMCFSLEAYDVHMGVFINGDPHGMVYKGNSYYHG